MDYLQDIGMQNVHDFERDLGGYLYDRVGPLLKHMAPALRSALLVKPLVV